MSTVPINPKLLRWACERSRIDEGVLNKKFTALTKWLLQEKQPTFKQLEDFSKATYTPVGYFFLDEPPKESLPIPDFRTLGDKNISSPSPNLLDTIYQCQQRQSWYQDFSQSQRNAPLEIVGFAMPSQAPEDVATLMRERLSFDIDARAKYATYEIALREFINLLSDVGVLVMRSGIVGNNTHRALDVQEFRGFVLADKYAPVIFVNAADSKTAQMFTLAHELAHLALGESALVNSQASDKATQSVERWCNQVAAELLMPLKLVHEDLTKDEPIAQCIERLRKKYKVSSLVVLRRLWDAQVIDEAEFFQRYRAEVKNFAERAASQPKGGGDFHNTERARVSERFERALYESALEGHTLLRDAMQMLGMKKTATFNEHGRRLGYPL